MCIFVNFRKIDYVWIFVMFFVQNLFLSYTKKIICFYLIFLSLLILYMKLFLTSLRWFHRHLVYNSTASASNHLTHTKRITYFGGTINAHKNSKKGMALTEMMATAATKGFSISWYILLESAKNYRLPSFIKIIDTFQEWESFSCFYLYCPGYSWISVLFKQQGHFYFDFFVLAVPHSILVYHSFWSFRALNILIH